MCSPPVVDLNPDRLLPAEPGVRSIARQPYQAVADLPIISPHGHVPAQWLADDTAFADGSQKLVVRTLPTIRAERAAGRIPVGCATTVAAWVLHPRGMGAPIKDPGAAPAIQAANSENCRLPYRQSSKRWNQAWVRTRTSYDLVLTQAEAVTTSTP